MEGAAVSATGAQGLSEALQGVRAHSVQRELRVLGDVLALAQLQDELHSEGELDAWSFITGAQCALLALYRDGTHLPSELLATLEGRCP